MLHISRVKCQNHDSLSYKTDVGLESRTDFRLVYESDSIVNLANEEFNKFCIQPNEAQVSKKLDSITQKLAFRLDSLSPLKLSDTLSRRVAHLRTQLDSLKTTGPTQDIRQVQERISSMQTKFSDDVKAVETKIDEKLGLFSKHSGSIPGSVNLPGANLGLNPNLEIPNMNLPSINDPLSKMENPLGDIDNPLENIDPKDLDIDTDLGGIPQLPEIGDVKALEEMKEIQSKLGKVDEVSDQVKGYQEDLQNLKEGNLERLEEIPDAIEGRVENLEQLDGVKEEIKNFDEIKKKWNDPEVLKEEALNKAKETAVNHFAGHEEQLKAVMEKMSKLKAKIPDPEGAIDLFAKRQQFLKGKPIKELLVPGLTLQFQNLTSFWLDLNPQLAFKITGRWQAGLGWNERFAYDFKAREWDLENRMYGMRGFVHFKLKENFWLKADVEKMNAPLRATPIMGSEIIGRGWIWSFFAGVKKDFQFSKYLKGNVQTMYNIYNPDKRSPYVNRLNVRIGFDFPLYKKNRSKPAEGVNQYNPTEIKAGH